jgi:hypothetical protein
MKLSICAAVVGVAALLPSVSSAQVRLTPADASRWDAGINVGWFGGNQSDVAGWNGWYDAASGGAAAGYYLTPHLKLEFDLSATASAGISVVESEAIPGTGFPYYRWREHRFRSTSVAGGLTYQFFQNAWFHPFLGGGVAVVGERERAEFQLGPTVFRDAQTRVLLADLPAVDRTRTVARPFATLGFKAYASERVFFRTDLRVAPSSDRVDSVVWRGGVGVDF